MCLGPLNFDNITELLIAELGGIGLKRRVLHVFPFTMVVNGHNLTDSLRKAICREKQRHPALTEEALCRWMLEEHGVTITQGTISNVLKRSADLLGPAKRGAALHSKRQRAVSYPLVDY